MAEQMDESGATPFFVSLGVEQALSEAARTGRDINIAGALYVKVNHGTSDPAEYGGTPTFEVWRVHPTGRPIRCYFGMDEERGGETLAACEADKADGYPDSPIEFHLVRATTTYVRVSRPGQPSPTQPAHETADDGGRDE